MAKNIFGLVHTMLDNDGTLEVGGTIEVYDAGTTTPRTVYSDRALTTTAGYVITADSSGRLPERWIADAAVVKLVYKNSAGSTLATRDYANDNSDSAGFGTGWSTHLNNPLPWFFAADYGVVADGATNNTTAMNLALAAVQAAGGGVLWLPSGVTYCTGQLTYTGSNLTITGASGYKSTLSLTYTAGPAFLVGATATNTQEVTVLGIRLVGVPSQIFFHQRYHRGFSVVDCLTSTMSTLIKAGDSGASGPAYKTQILGGEHSPYLSRFVTTAGAGTFTVSETVTSGGGFSAKVRSVSGSTIVLYSLSAAAPSGTITGGSSGATATSYTFTRGSHYVDLSYSAGAVFIRRALCEGQYDGAINGLETSNNTYTPCDQIEITDCYWARFNRNYNAVDVRNGNVSIYNNHLDEALEWAIHMEVTSSTAKAIVNVGFAATIIGNVIGSGLLPGRGINLVNARSTAGQDSGDMTIMDLRGQGVSGPLVRLKTTGGGVIRNSAIINCDSKSHVAATNGYEIDVANASDLPGCYFDNLFAFGAGAGMLNILAITTATPDSTCKFGRQIKGYNFTGAEISKVVTRTASYTEQVYTGSATYTPPANLIAVEVEVVGGGGGGGGVSSAAAFIAAGGGGQGGRSIKRVAASALGTTESITIGAGGTAGANTGGTGGTGGTSSFGAHATATGGLGGVGATAAGKSAGGAGGAGASGDNNRTGDSGQMGWSIAASIAIGGKGGGEGGGTNGTSGANGSAGANGGGGGGAASNGSDARTGGVGGGGYVIVREFYA